MTEAEAREWLRTTFDVSRETESRLEQFIAFLFAEGEKQNLISASTRDHVWARHIVDSAQLLLHARNAGRGIWLDLGSGAGFPGLIIAALAPDREVVLVESRRKRVEFLMEASTILGVDAHVHVEGRRLEVVETLPAAVISARAFAPLDRLLQIAERFSTRDTFWLLPKGRNAPVELEAAAKSWQGVFHVEQSLTDSDSSIIVARAVERGKS